MLAIHAIVLVLAAGVARADSPVAADVSTNHLKPVNPETMFRGSTPKARSGKGDVFDNALQAKHGHSPHGHDPHGHNPHRHNPHRHNPHRHNPHRHTPLPTKFPTPIPTRNPTTGNPTSKGPTTLSPTSDSPTTGNPTTCGPTTCGPTTCGPTTSSPATHAPTPIKIHPPNSPRFSVPQICRAHPLKKFSVPMSCPSR